MSKEKVVLLSTPTCGGCKMVIPIMRSKGLEIEVIDATEQPERASNFNTNTVPTIALENTEGKIEILASGSAECMSYISRMEAN